MKEAMKRMELFPLFCVSSELNYGAQAVLSTIVELMPNAYEMEEVHAFKGAEGDLTVEIHCRDEAPVAAHVFKTMSERIEQRLAAAPEATLTLNAKVTGSTVRVTADVSGITHPSDRLRLQIALVEEMQRYSGPNGVRFHPMVVRSLAGADSKGFQVPAKGAKVEATFDLAKILADNKKAIDSFLDTPFRGGDQPAFTDGRRDEIDPGRLMVVAFVQDEDPGQKAAENAGRGQLLRKVLQAASVKVPPMALKKTTN
jgi:translation elongation factor EF-G